MTSYDLEQARELARLANKVLEAVDAGDEQLAMRYLADAELAVTSMYDSFVDRYSILPHDSEMTREEDQLQRESDDRAAFNDRLDNLRNER